MTTSPPAFTENRLFQRVKFHYISTCPNKLKFIHYNERITIYQHSEENPNTYNHLKKTPKFMEFLLRSAS